MKGRNQERVARALKGAQKRGRKLTSKEVEDLYRTEKAPPIMDGASPLERRIIRRRVDHP